MRRIHMIRPRDAFAVFWGRLMSEIQIFTHSPVPMIDPARGVMR